MGSLEDSWGSTLFFSTVFYSFKQHFISWSWRYKPHTIELDTVLKPFIPELIPSIGEAKLGTWPNELWDVNGHPKSDSMDWWKGSESTDIYRKPCDMSHEHLGGLRFPLKNQSFDKRIDRLTAGGCLSQDATTR